MQTRLTDLLNIEHPVMLAGMGGVSYHQIVTAGGRVLGVTALGDTIAAAKLQAYSGVKCIRWPGAWCRKDISDKAIE